MRDHDLHRTALLVIDLQIGIDDIATGPRNHPGCERNDLGYKSLFVFAATYTFGEPA